MKQKQFSAVTFNRKCEVDPEKERYLERIEAECKKYAIVLGVFSNGSTNKYYTDFEREALSCLYQGKEIPDDIKAKLVDTLDERKKRNKKRRKGELRVSCKKVEEVLEALEERDKQCRKNNTEITEEEAERILGFTINDL